MLNWVILKTWVMGYQSVTPGGEPAQALEPFQEGMWVGTSGGLAFFVGNELEGLWPDGDIPSPFASNTITDVKSAGGRTWVATQAGVYVTTSGASWDSTVAGLSTRNVRSLAHDGTHLWAVTADGHVWSGGETGVWTQTETGLGGSGVGIGARDGVVYLGASYAVYDSNRGNISHFFVDYDIVSTQHKMRNAGLPEYLISRLNSGE